MSEPALANLILGIVFGTLIILTLVITLVYHSINNSRRQQESNEFSSVILDTSAALMIALDSSGRVLRFNQAFEGMTGLKASTVIGKPLKKLPQELQKILTKRTEGTTHFHDSSYFETILSSRGGSQHNIAWSRKVMRDEKGERKWEAWIGVDITERKRIEMALHQSEMKNTTILHAVPDLLFRVNGEGRYIDSLANNGTMHGLQVENVPGKMIHEVIPLASAKVGMGRIERVLATNEPELFEYRMPVSSSDQEERDFEARMVISGENEVLMIVRDITERRRAERSLQQAKAELEQRVQERTAELQHANTILKNEIRERREAEVKTKTAEEKYRRIFEAAPLMYIITRHQDGKPRIIDCNQQFLSSTGYEYDDVVNRSLEEFYSEKSRSRLKEGGYEQLLHGDFFDEERELIAHDGMKIRTLLHALPDYDNDGNPIGTRAMYVNITRREEAEAALRESIEQYRNIFETVGDGLVMTDVAGIVIDANPAACRMFGYTKEELIERSKKKDGFLAYYERAAQLGLIDSAGQPVSMETVEHRKSGEALFAEVRLSPVNYSGQKHLLAAIRDITKRKTAEQQIIQERDRAQVYLDTAGTMFLVINTKKRVELINRKGCEILGFSEKDIIGKNWFDNFRPARKRKEAVTEFEQVIKGKQELKTYYENAVVTRKGAEKIIAWHNALLKDADGTVLGTLSSGVDITNTMEAQDELRKHREHLEELVTERTARLKASNEQLNGEIQERKLAEAELTNSREQLQKLTARVETAREEERTHIAREIHDDLGQDLSIFLMNLSWLEGQLPADSEELRQKTHSMSEMVEGTIKKMRRISQDLRPSVLDHLGFAAAINWQTRRFQQQTGIACELYNKAESVQLNEEYSNGIFRIFQEALTNILRHAKATLITIQMEKVGDSLRLTVSDNGVGISSAEIHGSRSLGLLGMRERVRFLDGKFDIQGEEGKGTTVIVSVPLSKQEDVADA